MKACEDEMLTDAVVRVSAYFDGNQRKALIDADEIWVLHVLRLVNELRPLLLPRACEILQIFLLPSIWCRAFGWQVTD